MTFTMRAPVSTDSALIKDSWTINFSESGVRLRLRGQIEPGQIVNVYLNQHPERCRVVSTNRGGVSDELFAELEFIHPLPNP